MKQTFTLFLFIGLMVSLAQAAENVRSRQLSDTVFTPTAQENPIFPFQNIVYKRRLDSLKQTISLDYNEHVQGYIDIYLNRKEQIGKMLGLSKYYFPIFERALKEAGLPDELKFVTVIESSLNPHAVSRSGAVGPWQFMFTTAKGYGLVMDNFVDERKDPIKASRAAASYFLDAYKRIGDWLLAIAAFNCGTGAVTRAMEKAQAADFWSVRPFLPRETQNYVPAFIATMYAMNYSGLHGIESRPANFSIETDLIPVNRSLSIKSIATAAGLNLDELLVLNPAYKKQIVNGTPENPKSVVVPGLSNDVYASVYDLLNGSYQAPSISFASNAPTAKVSTPKVHKVKPGQNLIQIANLYHIEVQDIKAWNRLKTTTVVPGQVLRVSQDQQTPELKKSSEYVSYTVKAGDTLSGIAEKFSGATVSGIKALNGLSKAAISPGMLLKISVL